MTEKQRQEILEEWLRLHKGIIFKIVRAYTISDHDDLFQEILVQVWRSIPSFRKECAVSTWLYRIALNTAISWVKKEKKHSDTRSLEQMQNLLQEDTTRNEERLNWLYAEIYRLDKIDRSLVLLLLEGFSYKEISAILGIGESNVGVKINRIKKQLVAKSKKIDTDGI